MKKKELIKEIIKLRYFGMDCEKPGFDDAKSRIIEIIDKIK